MKLSRDAVLLPPVLESDVQGGAYAFLGYTLDQRASSSPWLYVAGTSADGGVVKIGVSRSPETRARELCWAMPGTVTILWSRFLGSAAYALEMYLHSVLAPCEIHMRSEWYALNAAAVARAVRRAYGDLGASKPPHWRLLVDGRRLREWSMPIINELAIRP